MATKASYTLLLAIPLWICAVAPLRADVTVRYESDVKMASAAHPPGAEKTMRDALSRNSTLRMKNGKSWSTMGNITHIMDYNTQQMTLLDKEHKTFAKLPVSELPGKMSALIPKPSMPESAKNTMAGIKISTNTKKTRKTGTIAGIQAEETETVISFDIGPAGSGFTSKVVMQIWNPRQEEVLRNQAVREFTAYSQWANYFMNPAATMKKVFENVPGFADSFNSMFDAMTKNNAMMLRMRMEMFMHMPSGMHQPGVDPDAPMFSSTTEAVEVSSAPVDESIFEIPADYHAVPAEELLKNMIAAQTAIAGKQ